MKSRLPEVEYLYLTGDFQESARVAKQRLLELHPKESRKITNGILIKLWEPLGEIYLTPSSTLRDDLQVGVNGLKGEEFLTEEEIKEEEGLLVILLQSAFDLQSMALLQAVADHCHGRGLPSLVALLWLELRANAGVKSKEGQDSSQKPNSNPQEEDRFQLGSSGEELIGEAQVLVGGLSQAALEEEEDTRGVGWCKAHEAAVEVAVIAVLLPNAYLEEARKMVEEAGPRMSPPRLLALRAMCDEAQQEQEEEEEAQQQAQQAQPPSAATTDPSPRTRRRANSSSHREIQGAAHYGRGPGGKVQRPHQHQHHHHQGPWRIKVGNAYIGSTEAALIGVTAALTVAWGLRHRKAIWEGAKALKEKMFGADAPSLDHGLRAKL
uniref:Uncharacterized protein n=1 Tax=Fibrocapsa japonica TaxID=94617 RepID=A0A7S2V1P3_9STRA|mmetsp:Transcript_2946/g.4329  ORF Transcript_2946/g.4329 Transcript_2946/m.4329 type:complete len:380 (+) Transcript_2946:115-1254(+)